MVLSIALAAAALAASFSLAQAPKVAINDPTLVQAQHLLDQNNSQAAHDLLIPWLAAHPNGPERDRAVYELAEVYYETGDRIRAFYHLDELMDNFPESKLYFPAMEYQYRIADDFLNGYKAKFLGLPIVSQTEEAIEMLYRIQERSPGSPLAERALKRTADYYFNTSDFDLAGDAYGAFIRMYPRSSELPQIRLRQAFSSLAQFRGPSFDATPLIDARAQFRQIEVLYPDMAAEANVRAWIDRIDSDLARKSYVDADFYRRTNQPHGAVYLYRYIIQTYPASHEADLARRDLAKMPHAVLTDPPPPPSNADEAAATQPSTPRPGANERPQ